MRRLRRCSRLSVVEPMKMGIFGAGFMNIRLSHGEQFVIDNYSQAPAAATMDMFTPMSDEWPNYMRARGGFEPDWCPCIGGAGFVESLVRGTRAPRQIVAERGHGSSDQLCRTWFQGNRASL